MLKANFKNKALIFIILLIFKIKDKMAKFRQVFDFTKLSKELYRWFPGHMNKGLRQIHEQLPNVDAVIEVHDARVFINI